MIVERALNSRDPSQTIKFSRTQKRTKKGTPIQKKAAVMSSRDRMSSYFLETKEKKV
jgi:hypothetical protein